MAAKRLVKTNTTASKTSKPGVREPEFPINVWLENSKKMIGHPRHIIVGATYGREEGELYSRTKMNELVKRFLSIR